MLGHWSDQALPHSRAAWWLSRFPLAGRQAASLDKQVLAGRQAAKRGTQDL
nr:hypothetical protein [Kibdelosporangium sp. MJ126-NF4]CTQ92744.1 hypothetical protein [Kibdelosporangium sp. MJ126-NF4]